MRNKWVDHVLGSYDRRVSYSSLLAKNSPSTLFGYRLDLFPIAGRITGDPPADITGLYLLDSILTLNWKALVISLNTLFACATHIYGFRYVGAIHKSRGT
jgi:hypothetical protein